MPKSKSKYTKEFDNGNWYVIYRKQAIAHFWSANRAIDYIAYLERKQRTTKRMRALRRLKSYFPSTKHRSHPDRDRYAGVTV